MIKNLISILREEISLFFILVTTILFIYFGGAWLSDLSDTLWTGFLFIWLFIIMLWASFSVVRHADALAIKLGEPYGTLILTISVISIEVIMVSAVMLTGADNPTLGRDMIFSVLMIVLNCLIGFSLLLGGLRHSEQDYNLRGANTYLAVLIPLAVLGLILPNYTKSVSEASFSYMQAIFFIAINLGLYIVFLVIQTIRHRDFFICRVETSEGEVNSDDHHEGIVIHSIGFHAILLAAYMLPIILLSKKMAGLIEYGISEIGAPAALGGLLVAILVLSPEGLAAIKSALADKIQRSINIGLGSALATIGLTIPAVLIIGMFTGKSVILGIDSLDTVILLLTIIASIINFSSGRSNMIQGLIHLILFATYLILIFD